MAAILWVGFVAVAGQFLALGQGTNLVVDSVLPTAAPLPDLGGSVLRVVGALILVLGLFLGGVWGFRNWQRLAIRRHGAPRLRVLEARSLGHRHMLYLVGCEGQRLLLSASPTGVNLISELPGEVAESSTDNAAAVSVEPPFGRALRRAMDSGNS